MAQIHKLVLDAATAVLSDAGNGFNASLVACAPGYQIAEVPVIDWDSGSQSVFRGNLGPGGIKLSQLYAKLELMMWAGAAIWTGETKGMKWSGRVELHLDFVVTTSHRRDATETIEQDETVSLAYAVFDAVVESIMYPETAWGQLAWLATPPGSPEWPPVAQIEDGWEQIVPIVVGFKVDIPY